MVDPAHDSQAWRARVSAAPDEEALRAIEREALSKDGAVAALLASIPGLPREARPEAGRAANELKRAIESALEEAREALRGARLAAERSGAGFDPTLPAPAPRRGTLHPLVRIQRRLEDLFTSMGYAVLDGPEVELDWYNFEALNLPADHPARDMTDTFVCRELVRGERIVLRTHTSPVQIRAMERLQPPFRAVVLCISCTSIETSSSKPCG